MKTDPPSINPAIIESLYREALVLADEARGVFERPSARHLDEEEDSLSRIALSCEALRTTTRMMHALAWLLNHRAFFAGELSEYQLRHHGRLPTPQPPSDPEQFTRLDPDAALVVEETRAFYARVERLDRSWRNLSTSEPQAVLELQGRLGHAFSA